MIFELYGVFSYFFPSHKEGSPANRVNVNRTYINAYSLYVYIMFYAQQEEELLSRRRGCKSNISRPLPITNIPTLEGIIIHDNIL